MASYAQKKPVENVHIIRERDRERFRELLALFSLGVPVGLFLLLFTWQNLEIIRLGREATRLATIKRELQSANKRLRLQVEQLTSLDTVENKASTLGFRRTDARSVVTVSHGPQDPIGLGPGGAP
ncbi:MAG TPA: hypothetical protein VHL58_00840 [Thermoanaerobaculia bacterium]|nr:hypothetical protein [Thermoanaerobaculia bacterium]